MKGMPSLQKWWIKYFSHEWKKRNSCLAKTGNITIRISLNFILYLWKELRKKFNVIFKMTTSFNEMFEHYIEGKCWVNMVLAKFYIRIQNFFLDFIFSTLHKSKNGFQIIITFPTPLFYPKFYKVFKFYTNVICIIVQWWLSCL